MKYVILLLLVTACAGGAEQAAKMPTPVLCKTVLDLNPAYIRYGEYLSELEKRNESCDSYVGKANSLNVR